MSLNGDYMSMAEAVGEAPPRTGITGSEYDEILHDCGDDYEMADYLVRHLDHVQTRDANDWYERNSPGTYEDGYRQALIDNGIDPD